VADVIGLVGTASAGSPQFTPDRFGNANDAILVNSSTSYWILPDGVYFHGDYTITAWVENLGCGLNYIGFVTLFPLHLLHFYVHILIKL
jgi:hypothetical protein